MKILLVEFNSAISGAEHSLLELLQGLQDGHEVRLACPRGPLADRASALGVEVSVIPASQLTFRLHPRHTSAAIASMACAVRRLRTHVRALRPDVVHANSIRAGMLAVPAAAGLAPVVVHCRDTLPPGLAGRAVRRALLAGADHVVGISRHVATRFAGAGWTDRRVTVVDNAVDLARFDPAAAPGAATRRALPIEGDPILSVIAQITPWKGQDLAIRVLGELRRRGLNAVLLVVGEAKFVGAATRYDNRAFEDELHALADALDLRSHVRFLGERPDPERILAATDVLLVPSIEEPFGRTIIEAMAMGVPVAATDVGGPPEILLDGVGGRTVHGREVAAWADVVEALMTCSAGQRAAARRVAAERYSRERHTAAMLDVYTKAIGRGAAAASSSIYEHAVRAQYKTSHACFESMPAIVRSRISPGMAVCEIGGGANPLLSSDERDRLGVSYTVIDVDASELAKAPGDICKIELDITATAPSSRFDLVISRHLAEHVCDPGRMHRNVHTMLNQGGLAIHFFPTLYAAPFLVNRLMPEQIAQRVLLRLQPDRTSSGTQAKFPAYYRWCRGPTSRQVRRLTAAGFEIDQYIGAFGHTYYARAPLIQRCEEAKTRFLLRHPIALLTSYAIVVLRRP